MNWAAALSTLLLCAAGAQGDVRSPTSIVRIGHDPNITDGFVRVENVGAGTFNPAWFGSSGGNWVFDSRYPLLSAKPGGSCNHNIYNANCVQNGMTTWNCYFGGWDGVSSCHDSISISVTEDSFGTMNEHEPMIRTGSMMHVNNPSAIKVNDSHWLMAMTELNGTTNKNRPGISSATNGIDWSPGSGETEALIQLSGMRIGQVQM